MRVFHFSEKASLFLPFVAFHLSMTADHDFNLLKLGFLYILIRLEVHTKETSAQVLAQV